MLLLPCALAATLAAPRPSTTGWMAGSVLLADLAAGDMRQAAPADSAAEKAPRVRDRHHRFPDATIVAPRDLTVVAKAFGNKKTNLTFVVPCTNSDAALQGRGKLLSQDHRGIDPSIDPSCFPEGSEFTAARCCDREIGGDGDSTCWRDGYNFRRCCPLLTDPKAGPPKDRWRTGGRTRQGFGSCWPNECFRGVFDGLISEEETVALAAYFQSIMVAPGQRQNEGLSASGKKRNNNGGLLKYNPLGRKYENTAVTKALDEMEALLTREFGAKDIRPAIPKSGEFDPKGNIQEIEIRTLDRLPAPYAEQQEKNMETSWNRGSLRHGQLGTWHWDNTDIDRLYSCVLFFGGKEGKDARGGEWLFADAIAAPNSTAAKNGKGHAKQSEQVKAGLMVVPKRSRAICYSAGAENVHAIAPSNSGFHGTMQVWWQCPGGAATGEHLQPGPVPPKFDKVAGRPAWQKDL